MRWVRWVAIVPFLVASGLAAAGAQPLQPRAGLAHDLRECREAGDFIRNAALSRDNGMSREAFLNRLQEDLVTIRAFPPALRWFVRNVDDEAFLTAEVEAVFDAPRAADLHRPDFIGRCVARPAG